jgi:hypothetical protein
MDEVIQLNIIGLGIIIYSDFAVSEIAEGEDYFSNRYQLPEQVAEHIHQGTIVGFCTSSPGSYILKFLNGYPSEAELNSREFKLRLGIEVKDNRVSVRDLYDLMDWKSMCQPNQVIKIENGFYHVTLCGNISASGILGDDQEIYVYLQPIDKMPELKYAGVPIYCE